MNRRTFLSLAAAAPLVPLAAKLPAIAPAADPLPICIIPYKTSLIGMKSSPLTFAELVALWEKSAPSYRLPDA